MYNNIFRGQEQRLFIRWRLMKTGEDRIHMTKILVVRFRDWFKGEIPSHHSCHPNFGQSNSKIGIGLWKIWLVRSLQELISNVRVQMNSSSGDTFPYTPWFYSLSPTGAVFILVHSWTASCEDRREIWDRLKVKKKQILSPQSKKQTALLQCSARSHERTQGWSCAAVDGGCWTPLSVWSWQRHSKQ